MCADNHDIYDKLDKAKLWTPFCKKMPLDRAVKNAVSTEQRSYKSLVKPGVTTYKCLSPSSG